MLYTDHEPSKFLFSFLMFFLSSDFIILVHKTNWKYGTNEENRLAVSFSPVNAFLQTSKVKFYLLLLLKIQLLCFSSCPICISDGKIFCQQQQQQNKRSFYIVLLQRSYYAIYCKHFFPFLMWSGFLSFLFFMILWVSH